MISTKEECSLLLFLYDDMQISSEECYNRITSLFTSIESHNPKEDSNSKKSQFLLFYSKEDNAITLKNRYYTCKIQIKTHPISKIKEIKIQEHEGIVIYLHQTSISNKTFESVAEFINENDNYSTCMVLFDAPREEIETIKGYEEFVGNTLDKHFEIICDCSNIKDFNQDDGIGVVNSSLHNSSWKASQQQKKEEHPKIESILEKKKEEKKEDKHEGYQKLDDAEELEKMVSKLKEIKMMNSDPNITDEERRNNAEKAVMMMAQMFGLDEEDEESQEENNK